MEKKKKGTEKVTQNMSIDTDKLLRERKKDWRCKIIGPSQSCQLRLLFICNVYVGLLWGGGGGGGVV